MKTLSSLSWQIVFSMALVLLTARVLTVAGTYVFYQYLIAYAPEQISKSGQPLTVVEVTWVVTFTGLTLALASYVAYRLAKRLITPLHILSDSVKQVSIGNLSSRATVPNSSSEETAKLINDFNAMCSKLEQLNNERQYWHAAIAHELRTPLTILQGKLQGVVDGIYEPSPELFKNLLFHVQSLGYIVEDLRTLGVLENGVMSLEIQLCDIEDELNSICDSYEHVMRKNGFTLQRRFSNVITKIDIIRFRQVVIVLLDNIVKYAEPGLVEISFSTGEESYILSVKDSGPGVPDEFKQEIFKPFFQHKNSIVEQQSGSGLGLSVVQAIAKAFGGASFCIDSDLGGSNVVFQWDKNKFR